MVDSMISWHRSPRWWYWKMTSHVPWLFRWSFTVCFFVSVGQICSVQSKRRSCTEFSHRRHGTTMAWVTDNEWKLDRSNVEQCGTMWTVNDESCICPSIDPDECIDYVAALQRRFGHMLRSLHVIVAYISRVKASLLHRLALETCST
ncbi:hypothetical protein BJ170DRAFT_123316 [Xylariales sp. AK1849]|nr:hypothetical protein BJ170DRAFT_123316 [Xylariales sp. AK1849]